MKFLICLFCDGELDLLDSESYIKKVRCKNCGYISIPKWTPEKNEKKEPEVVILRRK